VTLRRRRREPAHPDRAARVRAPSPRLVILSFRGMFAGRRTGSARLGEGTSAGPAPGTGARPERSAGEGGGRGADRAERACQFATRSPSRCPAGPDAH